MCVLEHAGITSNMIVNCKKRYIYIYIYLTSAFAYCKRVEKINSVLKFHDFDFNNRVHKSSVHFIP